MKTTDLDALLENIDKQLLLKLLETLIDEQKIEPQGAEASSSFEIGACEA